MNKIKQKIRESKLGEKNPNAVKVKCKNINTNEEYHFNTQAEMRDFFGETNHQFITRRCLHQIKCLYKNEWLIAYEKDEYVKDYSLKGQIKRRGKQIKITDLTNNKEYYFRSIRQAKEEMGSLLPNRTAISEILKGKRPQLKNYVIESIE